VSFRKSNRKSVFVMLLICSLFLLLPLTAAAEPTASPIDQNIFVLITDSKGKAVEGSSLEKEFRGAIEVSQVEFGLSNKSTIGTASGGAGAGKAAFDEITLTKLVDKSSLPLMQMAAQGEHFKLDIKYRKSGSDKSGVSPVYLTLHSNLGLISSYKNDNGLEELKILVGDLKLDYNDAATKSANSFQWSQITNSTSVGK
jgi:type VI protein secretion system component Hcp